MKEFHLKPSAARLLSYMDRNGGVTGREAVIECGVCDYRKRISEMRQAGIPIKDAWVTAQDRTGETVRFKRYYVSSPEH